jgi:hypothetical protein
MLSIRRTRLLALALLSACTSPNLATSEYEIRGGVTDEADPAVAALSIAGLYQYCTATLIAPHTLLTAGHCDLVGAEAEFGTQADSPSQSIGVADVKVHPMSTGEGKPYDVAVMKLESDPVGIAPVRLNDTPLTSDDVGRDVRHVGFGVTDDSTSEGGGTKRTVTYSLNRVDPVLIYSGGSGKQTCTGDSGGPAFMKVGTQSTETVVGIVSDGPDCNLSQDGWDNRVDVVKDWIVETVSAWDAPPSFGSDGDDTGGDTGGDTGSNGGDESDDAPAGGCMTAKPTTLWGVFAWLMMRRRRRARGARTLTPVSGDGARDRSDGRGLA